MLDCAKCSLKSCKSCTNCAIYKCIKPALPDPQSLQSGLRNGAVCEVYQRALYKQHHLSLFMHPLHCSFMYIPTATSMPAQCTFGIRQRWCSTCLRIAQASCKSYNQAIKMHPVNPACFRNSQVGTAKVFLPMSTSPSLATFKLNYS